MDWKKVLKEWLDSGVIILVVIIPLIVGGVVIGFFFATETQSPESNQELYNFWESYLEIEYYEDSGTIGVLLPPTEEYSYRFYKMGYCYDYSATAKSVSQQKQGEAKQK